MFLTKLNGLLNGYQIQNYFLMYCSQRESSSVLVGYPSLCLWVKPSELCWYRSEGHLETWSSCLQCFFSYCCRLPVE